MDLLGMLKYEDLDETQQELADCIGMESYKKLIANYAGENITVRMPDKLTLKIRNDLIRQEYRGGAGIRELAKKYRLSERTVRFLIAEEQEARRNAPLPGQATFFDDEYN